MYNTSAQKLFKGKRGAIERPNFGLSMPVYKCTVHSMSRANEAKFSNWLPV